MRDNALTRAYPWGICATLVGLLTACVRPQEAPPVHWQQSAWRAPEQEMAAPRARMGAVQPLPPRLAVVLGEGFRKQVQVMEWGESPRAIATPTPTYVGPAPPRISADGRYLVYTSPKGPGMRLVLWDIPGNREIILPGLAEGFPRDPDLSAHANYLIFLDGPVRNTRLRVYDRTRFELQEWPLPTQLAVTLRQPTLSGDGHLVAVEAASHQGDRNILLFERETQRPLPPQSVNSPAEERTPALSMNGRYLAYTSNTGGTLDILIYDRVRERAVSAIASNTLQDEDHPRFSGEAIQWLHYTRSATKQLNWVVSPFNPED